MITDTTGGPRRAPLSRPVPSSRLPELLEASVSVAEGEVEGIHTRTWTPATTVRASVVFCHGFMTQPHDYDGLMRLIASQGIDVVAPVGHRRNLRSLTGRRTVDDEAHAVERVVAAIDPTVIAGHSRGGLVAWIAAGYRPAGAVVAVDPVIGDARRGPAPSFDPRRTPAHVLVIGAQRSGRCVPAGYDHRAVAAVTTPRRHRFPTMPGTHGIIPMGHADLLDPLARFVGGVLCGGNLDATAVQATVAALVGSAAIGVASPEGGASVDPGPDLLPVEWVRQPA